MKEVTIKSKIVGRGGTDVPSRGGMDVSTDMSDYLLKKIWDSVFEIRTSEDGVEYLLSKMNMAVQGGISSFIDGGGIDLPGLYDGIPFDNRTIWMNPDTGVVEVIGGTGGGSISVGESGSGNAFTAFEMDGESLILVKGENFALQSDFENLQNSFSSFLEGSDTDTIINKWKELENFLAGLRESDNLADILSDKADKATTLAGYGITNAYTKTETDDLLDEKADWGTTLSHYGITNAYTKTEVTNLLEDYLPLTGGTVTGDLRLRTGSEYTSPYLYFGDSDEVYLKEATDQYLTIHADKGIVLDSPLTTIDGIEIKKSADGVLYIDANLVVSGGITMYGTDGTTSSSIWDGAPIASTSVKGIASFDSEFFAVSNGKVTFIGETGGGGIESITKQMVIDALGYTPYSSTNPSGYISGITKTMVTTALGYTPYNSTNPNGFITGITKSMVTSALGYTPYNSTNPNGYVTSSGSVAYATSAGSSDEADYATSAGSSDEVYVGTKGTSGTYPIVFVNGVGGDVMTLYTDTAEGAGYNPSVNQFIARGFLAGAGTGSSYGFSFDNGNYGVYANNETLILKTYSLFQISIGSSAKMYMNASGNFGIGTTSPKSKLHVNGDILSGGGVTMYSDERKKTILNHVELSLKEVAEAPLIEHYYNSDEKKTTHVGSIAQYWAGLNDWFCKKDGDGFYTMEIQNAALASAISVAREVVRLKNKISEMEKEIKRLKAA